MKSPESPFSGKRLRDLCWEMGKGFPPAFRNDQIHFSFVHPRRGFLWWHVNDSTALELRESWSENGGRAGQVLRVYDVTDILFDGSNANDFFDIDVAGLTGNHYLQVDRLGRYLLAETGLRAPDGEFRPFCRSNAVYFDRERPSAEFRNDGLFVSREFDLRLPVDSIFDAPVYERLNREVRDFRPGRLPRVACVYLGWGEEAGFSGPLGTRIRETLHAFTSLGGAAERIAFDNTVSSPSPDELLTDFADRAGNSAFGRLSRAHREAPFDLVHCHEWFSAAAGIRARRELKIPFLLQLYSTEHERSHGRSPDPLSVAICKAEKEAVLAADTIVVPHSGTRSVVTDVYGVPREKVLIVDSPASDSIAGTEDPGKTKSRFHLDPSAPMVLYCAEISHAAGADLLVDCLQHVCAEHRSVQFLFAGDGPLRGELEGRLRRAGLDNRARFVGDVSNDTFGALLNACEFVVIPARTWRDDGLAQAAIHAGKPVLVTHQAHINCVRHGRNGLVAYDNPNSLIWGVKELLANPPGDQMRQATAAQNAGRSTDAIAAELLIAYRSLIESNLQERPPSAKE